MASPVCSDGIEYVAEPSSVPLRVASIPATRRASRCSSPTDGRVGADHRHQTPVGFDLVSQPGEWERSGLGSNPAPLLVGEGRPDVDRDSMLTRGLHRMGHEHAGPGIGQRDHLVVGDLGDQTGIRHHSADRR